MTGDSVGTDQFVAFLDSNDNAIPDPGEPAAYTPVIWSALRYLALGDSFSSGEGVPPFIKPGPSQDPKDLCHRSQFAYSQDVTGSAFPSAANIDFWACSGAVIDNFMTTGQNGEPAQLSHLNAQDSLVSLTLGGNDVGFPTVMEKCLAITNCQNSGFAARVPAKEQATAQTLVSVYRAILSAAPNAQVYVLGYPQFLAAHLSRTCQLEGLDPKEDLWIRLQTANFDTLISQAVLSVQSSRIHFVDTLNDFAGNEACSPSGADVNGLNARHPEYSFHPTQTGQALLAVSLSNAVVGG
jgi:lysophospholipase L1-like esterase